MVTPIYGPLRRPPLVETDEPANIPLGRSAAGSDQELLLGLTSGGAKGFAAFYGRLAPALFSFACHILREEKEAEEALQESFVQMARDSSSFDPTRGSLFSWAVMITRSRALERIRQRPAVNTNAAATPGHEESVSLRTASSALSLSPTDDHGRVTAALGELPAAQREALELAFFAGMTPNEISNRLELSAAEVKAHLRSALSSLRDAAVQFPANSAVREDHPFHRRPLLPLAGLRKPRT